MIFLIILIFIPYCLEAVTVDTTYGPVQGQTLTLNNGVSVNTFLSIPFAKPPIGDLRFQKPVAPDPWTEPFVADRHRSVCPQDMDTVGLTHPDWDDFDEDCLHLNIYAPADQSGAPYPVMFYIHGGAYHSSANFQYPGHFLASRDTVVVVTNYRIGIFGFITTSDSVAPGNYGLWDQLFAMQFTKDNIAAFGGDPGKVTIFGQSCGGASVGIWLASPLGAGMFQQAIMQSGHGLAIWTIADPLSQPENYTKAVAEQVNCTTADSQSMMDCLRTKPWQDLWNKEFDCSDGYLCFAMQPVVDGPGGILPDSPRNLRESGQYNRVPIMSGWTEHDGALYVPMFLPPDVDMNVGLNRSDFELIIRGFITYFAARFPDREEDAIQAALYQYTAWPHKQDVKKTANELIMFMTDLGWGATADYELKVHTVDDVTYAYVFSYRSKQIKDDQLPVWKGAPHMMELPFVFGLTHLPLNPSVKNETGIYGFVNWDSEDAQYGDYVMDLWTNFAKHGNPTPSPLPAPGNNSALTWEEYELGHINFFNINNTVRNILNYRQSEYHFWTQYISWMIGYNLPEIPARQRRPEFVLNTKDSHDVFSEFAQRFTKRHKDV